MPSSTAVSAPIGFMRIKPLFFTFLLVYLTLSTLHAGPKHDTFRGKVVFAGPQAISVQSDKDIYRVRSFRYTPKLEKKILKHQLPQGKRVKVHYYRDTDLAFKVD